MASTVLIVNDTQRIASYFKALENIIKTKRAQLEQHESEH